MNSDFHVHLPDLDQTEQTTPATNGKTEIGSPFSVPYYFSALWAVIDAYSYGKAFSIQPDLDIPESVWEKNVVQLLFHPDKSPLSAYLDKMFRGYLHCDAITPEEYPRLSDPVDQLSSAQNNTPDAEKDMNSVIFRMKLKAALSFLTGISFGTVRGRERIINRVFAEIPQCVPETIAQNRVPESVINELNCSLDSFFRTKELRLPDDFGDDLFLLTNNREELKRMVEELNNASVILEYDCQKKEFYNRRDWLNYLNAYFELCKFLFATKNGILTQDELHNASSLDTLLKLGLVRYDKEKSITEKNITDKDIRDRDIYYSSLYSPMTLWAFLRFFDHLPLYAEQWPSNPDDEGNLFACEMQKASILSQFERTLRRRIVLKRTGTGKTETFLVFPHRFYSALQCVSYESLSSIESVRVVRLFEKIASSIMQIRKNIGTERNIPNPFVVSIFDFVERGLLEGHEYDSENRDINLLVNELSHWYIHMVNTGKLNSGLNIDLRFFTNQSPLGLDNSSHGSLKLRYSLPMFDNGQEFGTIRVTSGVEYLSYLDARNWSDNSLKMPSADYLKSVIEESQTVFFISCPWLSREDFQLLSSGSLESFSARLDTASLEGDLLYNELNRTLTSESILHQIEAQFGRIMNGEDIKFGYTTRVPKDYLLRWLQSVLENSTEPKEVYFYYPVNEGLNRSIYHLWPASRPEIYSDKDLRILRFSSFAKASIYGTLSSQQAKPIRIRYWSLLKATNILIGYVQLAAEVRQHYDAFGLLFPQTELVTLYRNIVLCLDLSEGTPYTITFSISTTPELEAMLKRSFSLQKIACAKEATERLLQYIMSFTKKIFPSFVFSDETGFGRKEFQDAFETVVYSAASCTEHMLFLHRYQKARKDSHLRWVSCEFNPELRTTEKESSYSSDAFSDKQIILELLRAFDNNITRRSAIDNLLRLIEPLYPSFEATQEDVIKRIQTACQNAGYTNSQLYSNLSDYFEGRN